MQKAPSIGLHPFAPPFTPSRESGLGRMRKAGNLGGTQSCVLCSLSLPGNALLRWQYIRRTKRSFVKKESKLSYSFPPLSQAGLLPLSSQRYPLSSSSCLQVSDWYADILRGCERNIRKGCVNGVFQYCTTDNVRQHTATEERTFAYLQSSAFVLSPPCTYLLSIYPES